MPNPEHIKPAVYKAEFITADLYSACTVTGGSRVSQRPFMRRSISRMALGRSEPKYPVISSPLQIATSQRLPVKPSAEATRRSREGAEGSLEIDRAAFISPPHLAEIPELSESPDDTPSDNFESTKECSEFTREHQSNTPEESSITSVASIAPSDSVGGHSKRVYSGLATIAGSNDTLSLTEAESKRSQSCVLETNSPAMSMFPCQREDLSPAVLNTNASRKQQLADIGVNYLAAVSGSSSDVDTGNAEAGTSSHGVVSSDPLMLLQQNLAEFEGCDAVFTVALDSVFSKLAIAYTDPESAYLFRDFAGNFTTLLDRFGPGGYDSHRAPPGVMWMLNLIVPWLHIHEDASPTRLSIFDEVNGWLQQIIRFAGARYAICMPQSSIWDSCIESMASPNVDIGEIAYRTAKAMVANLPLEYELVCRVFLMRNVTFGYESQDMHIFRLHRMKLLNTLVERIDNEKSSERVDRYTSFLAEIIGELERSLIAEADLKVRHAIEQIIDYAGEVYQSLDRVLLTPATSSSLASGSSSLCRRPRLSMNLTKWALREAETPSSLTEDTTKQSKSLFRRLRSFFKASGASASDSGKSSSGLATSDASSVRTTLTTSSSISRRWNTLLSPFKRKTTHSPEYPAYAASARSMPLL